MTTLNSIYNNNMFRANANNGIWCSFLLPLALLDSFWPHETVSDLKKVTFLISCILALISLHFACKIIYIPRSEGQGLWYHFVQVAISDLFERASSKQVRLRRKSRVIGEKKSSEQDTINSAKGDSNLSAITLVMTTAITVPYLFMALDIKAELSMFILGALAVFAYVKCLPRMFQTFPGSFTFGEGCIMTQAGVLFLFEATCSFIMDTHDPSTLEGSFSMISMSGVMSCLILIGTPLLPGLHWTTRTFVYIAMGVIILLGVTLPFLCFKLEREPITWTLDIIRSRSQTSVLMGIWILLTIVSVAVLRYQAKSNEKATTRTRKIFHLIMVIVYTTGIILDTSFTFLGSIVAFCVFLLLESFRFHKISPFDTILTDSFHNFLDEKDQGKLILTHAYLLVGCSLPLWLAHDFASVPVEKLLTGVLSIGIGDSAASIVGSKIGKLNFPDSQKSVEGTLASVVSQILFLIILSFSEVIAMTSWSQYLLPVIIVSLVEALTNQVDNLILPLILYCLL